jgi:hypothetical protein
MVLGKSELEEIVNVPECVMIVGEREEIEELSASNFRKELRTREHRGPHRPHRQC